MHSRATLLVFALLTAASASATSHTRLAGWESLDDDVLEFPSQPGLTIVFDGTTDLKYMRGRASMAVMLHSDKPSTTMLEEISGLAAMSGCVRKKEERVTLPNGWDSAWAAMECTPEAGGKPYAANMGLITVEGRQYIFMGSDFTLAELKAFAGSGRVIPLARRPTAADRARMDADAQRFAQRVDEVSGGPQLRSFIKVLIGLVILACVLLAAWALGFFKRPPSASA